MTKNPSNLHLMQEAEERRLILASSYRKGLVAGLWFGASIASLIITGLIALASVVWR